MAKAAQGRPGFLFLFCPDAQLLLEEVESLARVHAPDAGPFKRACFWGDEPVPQTFWESLLQRDLFGSMRLVLVRQANLWPLAQWKILDKALSRPLEGSWPLFCLENAWDRNGPKVPASLSKLRCFSFAVKQGWVWRSPGLTDRSVRGHIQTQAKARGLALEKATLDALCENTPRQAGVIARELDKLALLSEPGRPVPPSFLGTADWSPGAEVTGCVSCLMRGDARATWREAARLTDPEGSAFQLLGLLAWNFRTLWQLLMGDSVARPGLLTPERARRLGPRRLAGAMSILMETEAAIKTGTPVVQALEFTLSELLLLFRGV